MKGALLFFLLLLPLAAPAQDCTPVQYQKLLTEADRAAEKGQYDLAINKLQSAKTCRPEREAEVSRKIVEVFKKVNAEREKAIANEQEAKKQQKIAQAKTEEAKVQRDSAILAQKAAEKGRRAAENLAIAGVSSDHTFALQVYSYNQKQHPSNRASVINYFKLINDPSIGFYNTVYEGHKNPLTTIDISPDGKLAVSGSLAEPAFVWDIEQHKTLFRLNGDKFGFNAAVFSNSGEWILTANGTVAKLWSAATGQLLKVFGKPSFMGMGFVLIGFSPDDEVLTVGYDEEANLWDPVTGEKKATYGKSIQREVFSSFFSNDDPEPADIASHNKPDFLSEFMQGKYIRNIHHYRIATTFFDFNNEGILYTADNYYKAYYSDREDERKIQDFSGHKEGISALRLLGDDKMITGSHDGTVKVWDISSGKILKSFSGHKGKVTTLACHYSEYGIIILTGGEDKAIRKWNLEPVKPVIKFESRGYSSLDNEISPDGKFLLRGCDDKMARLLDLENGKEIRRFEGHQNDVILVGFSPDGAAIFTASKDRTVKTWDTNSGTLLATFTAHSKTPVVAEFSPDGKYMLTGSGDATLYLWNPQNGEIRRKIIAKDPKTEIESASLSPDGKHILIGYDKRKPALIRLADEKPVLEFEIKNARRVALSPNGDYAVISNTENDGMLKCFNARTGALLYETNKDVSRIVFSPDSKFIFTDALYDTQTGGLLREFTDAEIGDHDGVAFLSNGNQIILDDAIWCLGLNCQTGIVYDFSLRELRARGLQLEPEDLLPLWEQGETLSEEELRYIGKSANKKK